MQGAVYSVNTQTMPASRVNRIILRNNSLDLLGADALSVDIKNGFGGWEDRLLGNDQYELDSQSGLILHSCLVEATSLRNEVFLAHQKMDEFWSQGNEILVQPTENDRPYSQENMIQSSSDSQKEKEKYLRSRGFVPLTPSLRARVFFI